MTANSVGRRKMPVKGEKGGFPRISAPAGGNPHWLVYPIQVPWKDRRRVGSTPPVQETPSAYLAVAEASRGHPFTTPPEGAPGVQLPSHLPGFELLAEPPRLDLLDLLQSGFELGPAVLQRGQVVPVGVGAGQQRLPVGDG